MVSSILSVISNFIIHTISSIGYFGVGGLMAIESANIPLPSEVIMPFAGFLVAQGQLNLFLVALAGAFGCLVGSLLSYGIGLWGGRPLIEKWGKYILISHHDLDSADRWFKRFGDEAIFIARILPVIRTFISFPAGIAKMNLKKFSLYTFVGSFIWCLALAYAGQKLGNNWETLKKYFHGLDWVILILIILGLGYWIFRHIKNVKAQSSDDK
jgi:membrane protein DedA with SNARE-associated domain